MSATAIEMGPGQASDGGWKAWGLYGAVGLALLYYFHLFVGPYIDDAFITLSYAATLAKYGVWGMGPDLVSNAATSPLNVLLLAATIKIVRDPLFAICALNVLLGLLMYCSLRYFSRRIFGGEAFGLLATALLVANPLLASTQGLESYLLIALVLLACQLWDRQAYRSLGLVLGALFLTRPDALLVAFVFLALLAVRKQWADGLQVLGFLLLPALPWLGYSWYHLGSFFPDTLVIKQSQQAWDRDSFLQGPLLYWSKFPTATLLSIAVAPGLLFLRKVRGPRMSLMLGLGAYAALHFAAYTCLGVPPYHWYYAVEVSAVVLFGALAMYEASAAYRSVNVTMLVILVGGSAGCSLSAIRWKGTPAISTNWATASQYREIAEGINQHIADPRIGIDTELGTVQYYTHADMIDSFSDRSLIVAMLQKPHSRLAGALLRFNYRHLRLEDFSGIRYGLRLCEPGVVPEMQWETVTAYKGYHRWCLYKAPWAQ